MAVAPEPAEGHSEADQLKSIKLKTVQNIMKSGGGHSAEWAPLLFLILLILLLLLRLSLLLYLVPSFSDGQIEVNVDMFKLLKARRTFLLKPDSLSSCLKI